MVSGDKITDEKFQSALLRYQRAKARIGDGGKRWKAIKRLDQALENLLASPSPCFECFRRKIEILGSEYGLEPQPRHMAAIYADVRAMAIAA